MDFGFSEDQELLRDSARKFLDAECPTTFVRKMMEDDSAHATELWKKAAELGWMGILIPEEHGGIGGSFPRPGCRDGRDGQVSDARPVSWRPCSWAAQPCWLAARTSKRLPFFPRLPPVNWS